MKSKPGPGDYYVEKRRDGWIVRQVWNAPPPPNIRYEDKIVSHVVYETEVEAAAEMERLITESLEK